MNNSLEFEMDFSGITAEHLEANAHSYANAEVWALQEENTRLRTEVENAKQAVDMALDYANGWKEEWKEAANDADRLQRKYDQGAMKGEGQESYIAYLEGKLEGTY